MSNRREELGPAERIVETLLNSTDHIVHHRPGMMGVDRRAPFGYRWQSVTWKMRKGGRKEVFRMQRRTPVFAGVMNAQGQVVDNHRVGGVYRAPGFYPEAARWYYRNALEVWKLDNEFAARWASFAFAREHRDLKVVLAALMLVQDRCGEPRAGRSVTARLQRRPSR